VADGRLAVRAAQPRRGAAKFRSSPRLRRVLPDWREEDVTGSPYAISAYEVSAALGGEAGLAAFPQNGWAHVE